jgi:hypothetical protein
VSYEHQPLSDIRRRNTMGKLIVTEFITLDGANNTSRWEAAAA